MGIISGVIGSRGGGSGLVGCRLRRHRGARKRIPDMPGVTVCSVPATALAEEAGLKGLANVILVGKLFAETHFCSEETIRAAVASVVPARKKDKLAGNLRALELGIEA